MTGINRKVFLRALSWLWDHGNRRRIDRDMTKWSLWHLLSWLGKMAKSLFIFLFFSFLFFSLFIWTYYTRKECRKVSHIIVTLGCNNVTSYDGLHDECGKTVHRPCSSCISGVQEINKNSIKFSLSTQTWSRFKLSWLEPYKTCHSLLFLVYIYSN